MWGRVVAVVAMLSMVVACSGTGPDTEPERTFDQELVGVEAVIEATATSEVGRVDYRGLVWVRYAVVVERVLYHAGDAAPHTLPEIEPGVSIGVMTDDPTHIPGAGSAVLVLGGVNPSVHPDAPEHWTVKLSATSDTSSGDLHFLGEQADRQGFDLALTALVPKLEGVTLHSPSSLPADVQRSLEVAIAFAKEQTERNHPNAVADLADRGPIYRAYHSVARDHPPNP